MNFSEENRKAAERLKEQGFGVIPPDQYISDMEENFLDIWEKVRPFTMTSIERGYSLYKSVEYITAGGIPGDPF